MKNKFILPLLLFLSLLLVSCGGGGSGSGGSIIAKPPSESFPQAEKDFVYRLFTTEYLWYDEVSSNVDYSAFDTPQALINGIRVPQDKWSFMVTEEEYENSVNQKTAGFGFRYKDDFMVLQVLINAPAYHQLYRGDQILEINGETVTQENLAKASQNLNIESTFTVLRSGVDTNVTIIPREYTFNVTMGKILANTTIGYLRYDSFTGTSVNEFETEFTKFKENNITDLIIDLRYNGGGSVDVASALLDNITNQYSGKRQAYLDWNENYQSKNSTIYFGDLEPNDLDMKRVTFLVTKGSASASELVISALKPYLGDANVITIGDATHGKPVGMAGKAYGSNYYFLINFYVRNNAGETTSLDGIDATCTAEDDLTHLMGDPEETMLKTALHYLDTGNCL
jgi:C-terminal processing protease CtpA/Prc